MACVQTKSDPRLVMYHSYYFGYVFKDKSHVGSLSGGILQDHGNPFCLIKSNVDRGSNNLKTLIDSAQVKVASWMNVEQGESQQIASVEFIDQSVE